MDTTLFGTIKPSYTYTNPTRYFILTFLVISFIFIENKCFSDVIWNLKREKKSSAKGRFEPGTIASIWALGTHFTICATQADDS